MTTIELERFSPRPRMIGALRAMIGLGAAGCVAGLALAPTATLAGLLLATCYAVGLGLAAVAIIALDYVTKAGWGAALRRVPEALAGTLPISAALLMLTLLLGLRQLYPWAGAAAATAEAGHQGADVSLSLWRTPIFFFIRSAVYLLSWLLFAWALIRNSRRQDGAGAVAQTQRNVRLSAAFLVVFAVTLSLASFDWLMSLQPHWVSTIFGVYHFAGLFQAGLAAVTVLVIILRRQGYLEQVVSPAHLHDLGKYLFAFSTFWGYIWFSQYMLIWYSNIPEETSFYLGRHSGGWSAVAALSVGLNWAVPFFGLLSATAKRKENVLLRVSAVVLIGHWIDLYCLIVPAAGSTAAQASLWVLVPTLLVLPLMLAIYARSLSSASLIPVQDPMLGESLHHH